MSMTALEVLVETVKWLVKEVVASVFMTSEEVGVRLVKRLVEEVEAFVSMKRREVGVRLVSRLELVVGEVGLNTLEESNVIEGGSWVK